MRRLAFLAFALALALPAQADMYQDSSNAKLPNARVNLGGGKPVSVKDFGAKGDALTFADGVMVQGSTTLTSAGAIFTAADVGKKIQVDGAAGLNAAPLATTISAFVGAHQVTLAAPATVATPRQYFATAFVGTPRSAGNYQPGDVLPLIGGTSTTQAAATVINTKPTVSAIVAGGSGGTAGACVVQGTTGTGTRFRQNVTIAAGAITVLGAFVDAGHYFTNPTNLAAEPVTNAPGNTCAPTGATVSLTMGVEIVYASTKGDYSAVPANPVATGAGSLSGATGATLNVFVWNPSGAFVYGSDDSAPLKAAIDAAQAEFARGRSSYVFIPTGSYLIDATATPLMKSGLGIVGEGSKKTNLILGAAYAGDLFSWSEAWGASSGAFAGAVSQVSSYAAGPRATGFAVWGNRNAAATQNALVFYDRNDLVLIDDVDVQYINGRCFYSGALRDTSIGFMRESRIGHVRCFSTGSLTSPVFEFVSHGNDDATNEITLSDIDIYANYGAGFVFRNAAVNGSGGIHIDRLRIEGLQWANIPVDLMVLGDPVMTGQVAGVTATTLTLLTPYPNQAALRVTAPNVGLAPYFIRVENGSIGSGVPLGYGVFLEQGRNLKFHFTDIYSWNTNFTMGPQMGVVTLDGDGREHDWTYSLSNPAILSTPMRKTGYP